MDEATAWASPSLPQLVALNAAGVSAWDASGGRPFHSLISGRWEERVQVNVHSGLGNSELVWLSPGDAFIGSQCPISWI